VLDSSVLVPVWSRVVLQRLAVRSGSLYIPVWSEWIIAETWRVLAWRWRRRVGTTAEAEWSALSRAANSMLRYLLADMPLVSLRGYVGPGPWPGLRDDNDAPIWQTAILAGAHYVVSHALGDFPPLVDGRHSFNGIGYLTVIEFVEDVLGHDAATPLAAPLPQGARLRSGRVG
jgi:hypothetical protein